ncbi:MAG: hypothetical protein JNL74_21105 [Fibrobacteres bacterium]|nr:hypothetical protein [Fibrobacterota bacterium]
MKTSQKVIIPVIMLFGLIGNIFAADRVSLWGVAVNGETIIVGEMSKGPFISRDNGATWFASNYGLPKDSYGGIYVYSFVFLGNAIYAAVGEKGVFVSTNDGESWAPENTGLPRGIYVSAIMSKDDKLFVGCSKGKGVYVLEKNSDGWKECNKGLDEKEVVKLAHNGKSIFAGSLSKGLYVSNDNGQSWAPTPKKLKEKGINQLAFCGSTVFARSPMSELYYSNDNGVSWIEVEIKSQDEEKMGAIGANESYVFLGTDDKGVYISKDKGATFTQSANSPKNKPIRAIAVNGSNVYLATNTGLVFSPDNGNTWQEKSTTLNFSVPHIKENKMGKLPYDTLVAMGKKSIENVKHIGKPSFMMALMVLNAAIEKDKNRPEAYIALGNGLIGDNRLDKATEMFRTCLQVSPNNPEGHYGLVHVNYKKLMDYLAVGDSMPKAILQEGYDNAIAFIKVAPPSMASEAANALRISSLFKLALDQKQLFIKYMRNNLVEPKEANIKILEEILTPVISAGNTHVAGGIMNTLVDYNYKRKEYVKAKEYGYKVLELGKADPATCYNIATVLLNQDNNASEALKFCDKGIEKEKEEDSEALKKLRLKIVTKGNRTAFLAKILASKNSDLADEGVKVLINMAPSDQAYLDLLRWYQFSCTNPETNPYSHVLSKYGKEAMDESAISENFRGKYLKAFSDRSETHIAKLWNNNKKDLFSLLPKVIYNKSFKEDVDNLIALREKAEYDGYLTKLKEKSPELNSETVSIAADIATWSNASSLAFWYRRTVEKNDAAVLGILKEIKANYEK